MALDLKCVESVNGILSGETWPRPDFTTDLYSLIQKIYKNLLTKPGEDVFDESFGANIRVLLSITGNDVAIARRAMYICLAKVVQDLNDVNLKGLELASIVYQNTNWIVEVLVTTTYGTATIGINI